MKKLILICCSLTLMWVQIGIAGGDINKARLDSLFSLIENNDKGMGSISIFENGKEVYQKNYGFASLEHNIRSQSETRYRIGSISKVFTAVTVLKLAENNLLSLNDPLSLFFPDVTHAESITIEHLLRHQSGIFNFTSNPDFLIWLTEAHTRHEILEKIMATENVFLPGEITEYSNSNYVFLTFIAEDVTGKNFAELIDEYVARPLGLTNTYVGTETPSNEASSYHKYVSWALQPITHMSVPVGAGAIISTPTELNIFLNRLFSGDLLSENSLKEMTTIESGFGLGLHQAPFHEYTAIGHSGGIDGFLSNAFYLPEKNLSVAFCTNAMDFHINEIMVGVLSILLDKDYFLPNFETISLTTEVLTTYAGVYSSPELPINLTISTQDNRLIAQGSGQPSFILEAFDTHQFRFNLAGLIIEFLPEKNMLILKQGEGVFEMSRE
jgi:D-alanyl-D-alanine carboxypeptidase